MRHIRHVAIGVFGLAAMAPAHAQTTDPLSGVWREESGATTIRIAPCGVAPAVCATVVAEKLKAGEKPMLGQIVVRDFKPGGNKIWRGTYVADGSSMGARATLITPDKLAFKVCAFALMCGTSRFDRVRDAR